MVEHAQSCDRRIEITIKQAWELFEAQNRRCSLTGLPLYFGGRNGTTASLDRIDSSLGYLISNVQWIHKDVNRMKNHFDQDYFIDICKRIAFCSEYKVQY
jgi:hypothetical protein